ncbi:MAG: hypothetical protein JWM59_4667 [Verrucomicrobiales bacterium]|nr:hypothetical protein [Verrucomicrobiales bacterium]
MDYIEYSGDPVYKAVIPEPIAEKWLRTTGKRIAFWRQALDIPCLRNCEMTLLTGMRPDHFLNGSYAAMTHWIFSNLNLLKSLTFFTINHKKFKPI